MRSFFVFKMLAKFTTNCRSRASYDQGNAAYTHTRERERVSRQSGGSAHRATGQGPSQAALVRVGAQRTYPHLLRVVADSLLTRYVALQHSDLEGWAWAAMPRTVRGWAPYKGQGSNTGTPIQPHATPHAHRHDSGVTEAAGSGQQVLPVGSPPTHLVLV